MQTRLYRPDDYSTACEWWDGHDHPHVSEAVLPCCGVVVEDMRLQPVAMGWLYLDNSRGVSMLAWMVTNPNNLPRDSVRSLTILAEASKQVSKELGYGVLIASAAEGLARLLSKNGFTKTSAVPHYHLLNLSR